MAARIFVIATLLAAVALGVGLGNVLAGVLSRGRIELGIVPVGAAGIAAGLGVTSSYLFATNVTGADVTTARTIAVTALMKARRRPGWLASNSRSAFATSTPSRPGM